MTPEQAANAKKAAAYYAVAKFVQPGMRLGLGSGSTAAFAVRALADRLNKEKFHLASVVSTSMETAALALSLGIDVQNNLTQDVRPIDLTIDGADEFDIDFCLIKGGGGALVREKLVACASRQEVIVVDETKAGVELGHLSPLPVMIVPYGWEITKKAVETVCGRTSTLRTTANGALFLSDDSLYCLDVVKGAIPSPGVLEEAIKKITGVVDVGLFVNLCDNVVVGYADGSVLEPVKSAGAS
jgi:ribose 5-phosphate isomerase A